MLEGARRTGPLGTAAPGHRRRLTRPPARLDVRPDRPGRHPTQGAALGIKLADTELELVENWRWVLRYAWSLRLIILASALSGCELVVSIFVSDPPIPRGTFAVLAFLVTTASGIARVVAQAPLSGNADGGGQ